MAVRGTTSFSPVRFDPTLLSGGGRLATNDEGVEGRGDDLLGVSLAKGVEACLLLLLVGIVKVGGDGVVEDLAVAEVGLCDADELVEGRSDLLGDGKLGEDLKTAAADESLNALWRVKVDDGAIKEMVEEHHALSGLGIVRDGSKVDHGEDSSGCGL